MTDRLDAHWHQLRIEDVLARLETSFEGLSEEEAALRLERYGPNELPTEERALPLVVFLRQIQSPLIYILLAAGFVTAILGKYVDTVVILAVVVVDSVLGFVQEYKAEEALRALAQLVAPRARVLRDGREREIEASDLAPGDVVFLESGVRVPADVRLFRVMELQVDESNLTGESVPVSKKAEPVPDPDAAIGDRADMAFMGTTVLRGRGLGVVVATGVWTVFGRISSQMRQLGEVKSPLQSRLNRLAQLIALVVLGVTALVFALGLTTGESLGDILLTAVATAVATVPEGLPITITVTLAVGVRRMARRNAIIRKLAAVETLGSCTTICSDKTGTLTKNEMTVKKVYAVGEIFEISGVGYSPRGKILLDGKPIDVADYPALELALRIGLLCNHSSVYEEEGRYKVDGDPTEGALIVAAMKAGFSSERELVDYPVLDEVPFESERQYMATLHGHDRERLILAKGAPERIIEMCETLYAEALVPVDREAVLQESHKLAGEGLRVLGMAYKMAPPGVDEVGHRDVEAGLIFAGLQALIDPPRPEAIEAVGKCKRAGIRAIMITGDHRVTAAAIAEQIGIIENIAAQVIDGRTLVTMDDEELYNQVDKVSVFARVAPQQKLRIVQQLRRRGEVVAVTGDGVNDGPALKQADIGVAMGITGSDVAREAADMVLADDNFATIYAAVEEGRVVFDNIRKVIMFLIPTGLGLVLTVIASMVLRLPLPFLPAQAIWINLVTNGAQDVAMAFEPAEAEVGLRPPRDPREGIITWLMVQRTILVGLVLLVGTLGAFIWQLSAGASLDHARTVAVSTMVLFQNFHIFNSRSFSKSIFQMNPLSNRFLFASIVGALGLQILALYWGPLQFVLRTEPLSLATWLVMVAIASTVLIAGETDKLLRRMIRIA